MTDGPKICCSSYFIEVWLRSFANEHIKDLGGREDIHPHITLVRPFRWREDDETLKRALKSFFDETADFIPFSLSGVDYFRNDPPDIYMKVESQGLLALCDGIERLLERHAEFVPKLSDSTTLHAYIESVPKDLLESRLAELRASAAQKIDQYLIRVTTLKDKRILFEYDVPSGLMLDREAALNKDLFRASIAEFSRQTGWYPSKEGFVRKKD